MHICRDITHAERQCGKALVPEIISGGVKATVSCTAALSTDACGAALRQVKVAHQVYDFVDARIQELDAQLGSFDAELALERSRLGVEKVAPSLWRVRSPSNPSTMEVCGDSMALL